MPAQAQFKELSVDVHKQLLAILKKLKEIEGKEMPHDGLIDIQVDVDKPRYLCPQ